MNLNIVDAYRNLILETQDHIWKNAETGYREIKTAAYMEKVFEDLGYELVRAGDIPGFYTDIDTGKPGPKLLIFGELDSLICPEHPEATERGTVHCCGHSAQCAALVGIAAGLKAPGALDGLCGSIRLCAVPAEELIEIEYREELKKQGKIRYYGGKVEFLYRGFFDGCDIVYMLHTAGGTEFFETKGSVGCISKRVIFKGVSAHAGGSPSRGINALYAANLGLNAINAIRETFRERDQIRVHPIITQGGGAVNAIPDCVKVESYVRGASFDAIRAENLKVNRALVGAALSMGANVEIIDEPGYAPLDNCKALYDVMADAAADLGFACNYNDHRGTGCTDMGDISCIFPSIHGYAPGAIGTSHGTDYYIADPDLACVASAKVQLKMAELLLKDGAARAKEIIEGFEPLFASKEEYFAYVDEMACSGDRIVYGGGKAEIKL
ncbi:MAG: amidohydrolase [Clostridia bacterium]|nr:amidohydrolase [Clostridia bacterium]